MIVAYKGFNSDLTCRGFQFKVGETYEESGTIKVCVNGFHACENPLDVLAIYSPATSRYAEVTLAGALDRYSDSTKIAAARVYIKAELTVGELIQRAANGVLDRMTSATDGAASATVIGGAAAATGDRGSAYATGYRGAASATGYRSAAAATERQGMACVTGDYSAAYATGYRGAASETGDGSTAHATGRQGIASATGDFSVACATGYQGAASATGDGGVAYATGRQGIASATGSGGSAYATGSRGAASATGDKGEASSDGNHSVAQAVGFHGRARGKLGCAIFLVNRDNCTGGIRHAWAGVVGRDGIAPNTWYTLSEEGIPTELQNREEQR